MSEEDGSVVPGDLTEKEGVCADKGMEAGRCLQARLEVCLRNTADELDPRPSWGAPWRAVRSGAVESGVSPVYRHCQGDAKSWRRTARKERRESA